LTNAPTDQFPDRPTVAIVGGGICGLGIGWRLAAAGCAVDVFEKGKAGREASWAAAGLLAANVETEPGEEALLALNLESQAAWPDFATELEAVSGVDLGYRDEGILVVAAHRDDAAELRNTYEFHRSLGLEVEWLTGGQARRMEPHLAPGVSAAVSSVKDHQVDNRQLVRALHEAFLRSGGRLHEDTTVEAIDVEAGQAKGIQVAGQRREADMVLLAAGAWSYDIDGVPPVARPPVRPLKGQVIALQMEPRAPIIDRVIWGPGIYLVPRRDGTLILGATVEEKGFDSDLTAGGVFRLLEAAWEILPQIEELPIKEMWVGFRPTSRDDAPILGPTAVDGLVVATGHHRNGVLLAPLTIDAVSAFMLDGTLSEAVEPFGIGRFNAAAAAKAGSEE
jgi:glycine oxidase